MKFPIVCRFYTAAVFILLLSLTLKSQSNTVFICNPGDPIQLRAPQGNFAYQWTPTIGLDNPTIATPIATPTEPTTYVVRMISNSVNENLIFNPNFNLGNDSITSDYPLVDQINTQGVYGIDFNPANLNSTFFASCSDHTTGDGPMMVVDGSPAPNEKVWCQTIPVFPNTNYALSTWLMSVNVENPAALQFSINGTPIGNTFRAGTTVCEWRQFFEVWDAGTSTSAEICVINQNTNPIGNDFALDDFAFYELDAVLFDSTRVLIEALSASQERRVYFPNAFSPNGDGQNDIFFPQIGKGVVSIESFAIFNRWGEQVFEALNCPDLDISCGWNGTLNGTEAETGIYVYAVQVQFADQVSEIFTGSVWLAK